MLQRGPLKPGVHSPLPLQSTPKQWSVSLQSGPVKPGTHCVQSDPLKFPSQNTVIVKFIVIKLYIPVWFCCRDSATVRLWSINKRSTKSFLFCWTSKSCIWIYTCTPCIHTMIMIMVDNRCTPWLWSWLDNRCINNCTYTVSIFQTRKYLRII